MDRSNEPLQLPEQYRPLSALAYFGHSLLFSIPVVGLICLIVFGISDKNINRRNFARSYWIIYAIVIIIMIATGGSMLAALSQLQR